jgi:hypothetical protein
MCCGGTSGGQEFYFSEEDIKNFVAKLKIATKRMFTFIYDNSNRTERLNHVPSNVY